MKTRILSIGILALALGATGAEPKSVVKEAIKKLSDQSGYSWVFTPKTVGSEAAAKLGPIQGKTVKEGVVWLKGTSGENSFEAAVKGTKYAVNYNGEWIVVDEDDEATASIARRLKAVKNPLETADELVAKVREFKKEPAGLYSGDLTDEGAKEVFGKLGKRAAAADEAKGSVKYWVKDGLLTKYEFIVKGKITVGADKREVELSRTVTVEFLDIGSTKITLPEEVKKKLS